LVFAAVLLMTVAVGFGSGLALWHLRAADDPTARPPVSLGIVHGLIGACGLVVLLLALRGPPRAAAAGAGSFGEIATLLFAAAIATGLVILVLRRKRPAVTMAIHAGLAITGYMLLLAWYSLG
jgi:hypothetical protein